MAKLKPILFYTLLALALGCLYIVIFNPLMTVTITLNQVQQTIDAKLPLTTRRTLTELTVQPGTEVSFNSDNTLSVRLPFSAKPTLTATTRLDGVVQATSGLRYENRAFYLANVQITDLQATPVLSERTGAALNLLRRRLANTPEDRADWGKVIAPETLREHVSDMLTNRLATTPVYRLQPTLLHSLAGASLQNIRFSAGEVHVSFSARTLLVSVVLGLVVLAMAALLAFGIIAGGGMGGVLFFSAF
jgi:hypothetical protein